MSLKEKLMDDLKTAMRDKDKLSKDAITMIRADIKRKEVDERIEVTDEQILDIISKQLKEKKASIEDFKKGNRQDLVDKTNDEIKVQGKADGKEVNRIALDYFNEPRD